MSEMKSEEMSFEETLAALEKIITGMERADMELDKLVEAYAQGMALEKKARKKLDDMRKKIEVLADKSSGRWQEFDAGSNREHGGDLL